MGPGLVVTHIVNTFSMIIEVNLSSTSKPCDSYGLKHKPTSVKTDCNKAHENKTCVDWDYTVSDKVLSMKHGILHKTESKYESNPWTITSIHTNGTVRVQCKTKSERLKIRRVTPYFG